MKAHLARQIETEALASTMGWAITACLLLHGCSGTTTASCDECLDADTDRHAADAGRDSGLTEPVWVGVGNFGLIASTHDGTTWYKEGGNGTGNPHTPDLLRGVGYEDGLFIAVGGHQNTLILRSTDGENWVDSGSEDVGPWISDAAGFGDVWVAAGALTILRSSDRGLTWTTAHASAYGTGVGAFRAVGKSPQGDFVVGGDDGTLFVSDDEGATWENVSVTLSNEGGFNSVAYHGGTWIAAGRGWVADTRTFDGACHVSKNLRTWTECPFDYGIPFSASSDGDKLHLFSDSGRSESTDGATWVGHPGEVLQAVFLDGTWIGKRHGSVFRGSSLDAMARVTEATVESNFRRFTAGFVAD